MRFLDKVNSTEDLKKLTIEELNFLAEDIRQFLVESVSKTGGHLSSNLGIVEITIALNYYFNVEKDRVIYDVGHQAYVHKILTGRKDEFDNLRKLNGLSGFPKEAESIADAFDTGHSSTSISVAGGMCTARDLQDEDYNVVAVIGDGAMTGGMVFEALNDIGRRKQKMLVILNDNQMSISESVGAVSKTLSNVRLSEKYTNFKKGIDERLSNDNKTEKYLKGGLRKFKNTVKSVFVKGQIFEQMGFTYIGPIDGHNISSLIYHLDAISKLNEPVLLHVNTVKGKGYKYAEENSSKFHGISAFDRITGNVLEKSQRTYSNVVGDKFSQILAKNKKVVLVSAAMISGTGIEKVKNQYPKQVIDVGICEQHATTYCAGMSAKGLIPVFLVYSTFLQRAYDQIVHDVCITKKHVIFMIDRAGLVGADGETHQGIFDVSFLSHIPNMTIVAPKSDVELEKMMDFAVGFNAPIAVRYPRGKAFEYDKNDDVVLGKSELIFEGEEILIVSVGNMFPLALSVYEKLKENNIKATLINARFIKPIDKEIATKYNNYKKIITIEESIFTGSFSQNLLTLLYMNDFSGKFIPCTLSDDFIEQGSISELRELQNLTLDNIYNKIIQ